MSDDRLRKPTEDLCHATERLIYALVRKDEQDAENWRGEAKKAVRAARDALASLEARNN